MNRFEQARLRQAIRLAIESRYTLIDAHRVGLPRGQEGPATIPPEHRVFVKRWQRDIKAFRRLAAKYAPLT